MATRAHKQPVSRSDSTDGGREPHGELVRSAAGVSDLLPGDGHRHLSAARLCQGGRFDASSVAAVAPAAGASVTCL
jgi:hypothetical protein